jgi:hypothetical protein
MLMHLPQPFTPSQYLQPALLPILSAAPGQDVTYAGDILGPMAQILRGQVKSTPGGVWHQTFDASSPTASLCPGDSGGGLITDVSGLNFVAGVLKEGPRAGCNAPGETFTATNVYWYLSWIYEHTGALGVDPASDLLWTSTSNWDIWSMRDGRYQFDTSGPKNTDLSVVGTGDFNGDGTSDILWKNVDGQLLIWHMREGRNVGSISLGGDPGYEVKAIADTNGDKIADIVLHNASTGDVVVWQMAAPGYRASEGTLPKVDPGWEILGAGDFNHDGKDDLIWRQSNTSPNPLAVWFLDGTSLMGQDPIYPDTVPPDYSFVGIGDLAPHPSDPRPFKDDIVWIDSAGKVQIWYFVGVNGLAGFKESTAGAVSTNWVLKQVADVNGDGTSDLVWIRNETHEVVSWLMSWDTTTEEWQYVAWDSGTAPLGFTLDAAAPFD